MKDLYRIFEKCRKNDRRAQKMLFDLYRARIMGICRRYTANREEAEDVFQEAFVKIFKGISSVEEYLYLERWMIRTSINTSINYYHRNKRHHDYLGVDTVENFTEKESDIVAQLDNSTLLELINELPDRYRMVFNLYVIEGYKHREIALMLDITENTSKSQLSRAKVMLKEKLQLLGIDKFEKYG
ncbi:RNA polymerase sigma factor [Fulvivirga sp. M361]|uniref:RNA polymerase sigma factor n=1 Tax=Fulvivirga sp. M361 TaxID=2594266 RepID=UPI0011798F1E|nr:RNA polymerase sigma factor [Fulvivirga sp. M361]TRX58259.1 RNA polymerase sigma factor [Fulvivirga sp. M361]